MIEIDEADCNALEEVVDRSERRKKRSFFRDPQQSGRGRLLGGPDPRLAALGVEDTMGNGYTVGTGMGGAGGVAREWNGEGVY